MKACIFLKKYGFLTVLLYVCGLFTPDLTPKVSLLELDLNTLSEIKSGSDSLKQFFWLSLTFLYSILFLKEKNDPRYQSAFKELKLPILFFGISLLIFFTSCFWSDFASITIKRAVFQLLLFWVLIQSYIFSMLTGQLVNNVRLLCLFVLAMIVFSIVIGSGINPYFELAGFSKSKNIMGAILAVLIVFSHMIFVSNDKLKENKKIILILGLFLVFTVSKTSILLVALYFLLTQLPSIVNRAFSFLSLSLVMCLFIVVPYISYLANDFWNISLLVDSSFMTGRGAIWENIYHDLYYFDKINLGYGYGSYFGTPITPYFFDDEYSFMQYINSAHNGYIELLSQVGIFSFFIIIFYFLIFHQKTPNVCLSALSFPIFYNISEPAFFRDQHIVWILCLLLICVARISRPKIQRV
jgi:O-antigen ligase